MKEVTGDGPKEDHIRKQCLQTKEEPEKSQTKGEPEKSQTKGEPEKSQTKTLERYKIPKLKDTHTHEENKREDKEETEITIGEMTIQEEVIFTESEEENENKKKALKRPWRNEKSRESDSEEERRRNTKTARPREPKEPDTEGCTENCNEEMPRNWCMRCKQRELQEYRNYKDYNFQAPSDPLALDWCVKRGVVRNIPRAQGQIHKEDIRRYKLFKRKNRFLHCDETIMRRREGLEVDDAFHSFMNSRDPEGDLHISTWCPKLNPIFCKKTNNFHRCSCDKHTPVGTVRQFVLHTIQNHSHIHGKQVECLECAAQGHRNIFMSPQALWRHINNLHEKTLMIGHLKLDMHPEFQSNNDTDRFLNSYSQLIVACVLETLHHEGSLTDSFFRKERKEEDLGGARSSYQQRGASEGGQESPNERRGGHRSERQ